MQKLIVIPDCLYAEMKPINILFYEIPDPPRVLNGENVITALKIELKIELVKIDISSLCHSMIFEFLLLKRYL